MASVRWLMENTAEQFGSFHNNSSNTSRNRSYLMDKRERKVSEFWDVKSGCKMHTKGGRLIPTVAGRVMRRKKTRVVIEIWGFQNEQSGAAGEGSPLLPGSPVAAANADGGVESHYSNALARQYRDGDSVILRLLRPKRKTSSASSKRSLLSSLSRPSLLSARSNLSHQNSDASNTNNPASRYHAFNENDSLLDEEHDDTTKADDEEFGLDSDDVDWLERHRYTFDTLENMTLTGSTFSAKMGFGQMTVVRDFVFQDRSQAQSFMEALTQFKEVQESRTSARIANANLYTGEIDGGVNGTGSAVQDEHAPLDLLIEIVSAKNLPIADIKSTDPFVTVWHGRTKIHSTKYLANNLNPIWTLHTRSLFIFSTTYGEFFSTTFGLTFLVMDFDATNRNDHVAQVQLTHEELLWARGERKEYPLRVLLPGYDHHKQGHSSSRPKLMLRVRRAGKLDFEFMEQLNEVRRAKKKRGIYADTAFVAPNAQRVNRLKQESKKDPYGAVLHRVKPGPDPNRPKEMTTWMTDYHIEDEAHRSSMNWIEAGSGDLARIYLEIIGCDDLPNLDSGIAGDKTDAFCTVVYEDAIVNTDVINDCLSPRWLPWTQRAFVLNVEHPSSHIFIGVFDYDGISTSGVHDNIGRVAVDVTSFTPNTEYNLTYNLYKSNLYEKRKIQGKLKIRLRMELKKRHSTRSFLLTSMKPPPMNYINVAKKADFKVTHFVCHGDEDLHRVDIPAFKSYAYELEFKMGWALYYATEGLKNIILWRGHHEVQLCWCIRFHLPIHSIVAFLSGIVVLENFNLLPSYFFFCLAWFFLARNGERRRHPSRWNSKLSFSQIWWGLLLGRLSPQKIEDNEQSQLIGQFEAEQNRVSAKIAKAIKSRDAKKPKKAEEEMSDESDGEEEEDNILLSQLTSTNRTDITSRTTSRMSKLNPLKPILLPIQTVLGNSTKMLRVTESVVTWDETYAAFLITNACLLGALMCYCVPWGVVIRWSIKILVWTVLGPWMKLVDWFFVAKLKEEGQNWAKRLTATLRATWTAYYRPLSFLRDPLGSGVERENALKLRSMKKYMFGKYTTSVPSFKSARFQDVPLPESYCFPSLPDRYHCNIVKSVHGQRLVGDMIPKWADSTDHEKASIGSKMKSFRHGRGSEMV